ncbi:hypothetical protein OG866_40140 [Streptomyces sp. NBC_00663]|uniref:hypothetical protein n=1 Tax=Streptomyces sp. NBC_00663 TaxID=2975801 RepID=UPI002E33D363|nr:hypothetical protein [Streptomyces sp. NBC_00663]
MSRTAEVIVPALGNSGKGRFAPSPGCLVRTDHGDTGTDRRSHQTPERLRDPRRAW